MVEGDGMLTDKEIKRYGAFVYRNSYRGTFDGVTDEELDRIGKASLDAKKRQTIWLYVFIIGLGPGLFILAWVLGVVCRALQV